MNYEEKYAELVKVVRELPIPVLTINGKVFCGYCLRMKISIAVGNRMFKDGDLNLISNHDPDCLWRKLKEMVG